MIGNLVFVMSEAILIILGMELDNIDWVRCKWIALP